MDTLSQYCKDELQNGFNLRKYFVKIISRENYDPDEKGIRKDIGKYNYPPETYRAVSS
jgi:hypothetical protein